MRVCIGPAERCKVIKWQSAVNTVTATDGAPEHASFYGCSLYLISYSITPDCMDLYCSIVCYYIHVYHSSMYKYIVHTYIASWIEKGTERGKERDYKRDVSGQISTMIKNLTYLSPAKGPQFGHTYTLSLSLSLSPSRSCLYFGSSLLPSCVCVRS